MMNPEQRDNHKFRQKLQKKWIDEAKASAGPIPVDADKLWHEIDQSLTREKLSLVKPRASYGQSRYWALPLAAALALMIVMSRGYFEGAVPKAANVSITPLTEEPVPLETMVSTHREPLQTPSRMETPRCDQTRQSCMFMAFL